MDWLLVRQERIEKVLADRHLAGETSCSITFIELSNPDVYGPLSQHCVRNGDARYCQPHTTMTRLSTRHDFLRRKVGP
jgi:hypothetical protein